MRSLCQLGTKTSRFYSHYWGRGGGGGFTASRDFKVLLKLVRGIHSKSQPPTHSPAPPSPTLPRLTPWLSYFICPDSRHGSPTLYAPTPPSPVFNISPVSPLPRSHSLPYPSHPFPMQFTMQCAQLINFNSPCNALN